MTSRTISLARTTAVLLLSGAIGWLAGALPWLAEGGRLPISSAWPSVAPDAGPWVPLPAGEHRLSALLVTAGLVGVVAVVAGHLTARRPLVGALGAGLAGLVAIGDLWRVLAGLADGGRGAQLLITTHVALAVLGLVVGTGVGIGCCRGPRWARATAWGASATVGVSWLADLAVTDPVQVAGWQSWVVAHQQHLLAVALAVVVAAAGWRPPSTLVGWVGALVCAWVIPAGLTALSHLGSSAGGWASSPAGQRELVDGALDVLRAALDPTQRPTWPLLAGIALGAAGAVVVRLVGRRGGPLRPVG